MMVRWLTRYGRRDEGSMTLLGIYVLAGGLLISAFAIDFAYLLSARTQLQVAADSAAHAALYFRETNTEEQSKLKAVEMAQHDMPASQYGAVLEAEDVEFGSWDYASKTFTPASGSMEAVRVRPSRIEAKGNAVAVFLFRLLDRPEWDVAAQAIFVTFQPHCFREGFVAQGVVDIQSNNGFADGFCLHSNTYVSVNQNNTFEPGTVVSMPDSNDIDMPRSGFEKNEGLQAALRNGFYRLRMLLKLDEIYDSLYFGYGDHVPDYITASVPIVLSDTKLGVADFEQGRIHRLNCGGKTINIDGGITLRNIVIITDCDIKFGNDLIGLLRRTGCVGKGSLEVLVFLFQCFQLLRHGRQLDFSHRLLIQIACQYPAFKAAAGANQAVARLDIGLEYRDFSTAGQTLVQYAVILTLAAAQRNVEAVGNVTHVVPVLCPNGQGQEGRCTKHQGEYGYDELVHVEFQRLVIILRAKSTA